MRMPVVNTYPVANATMPNHVETPVVHPNPAQQPVSRNQSSELSAVLQELKQVLNELKQIIDEKKTGRFFEKG